MDPITQLRTSLNDRYEIDREVGAGGMATVYLARDLRHDRHVALKVLNPDLGAVLGLERFLAPRRASRSQPAAVPTRRGHVTARSRSGRAMMSARVSTTPEFRVLGRDTVIANADPTLGPLNDLVSQYDVDRDGRFIGLTPMARDFDIVVSPNWIMEFRERIRAAHH